MCKPLNARISDFIDCLPRTFTHSEIVAAIKRRFGGAHGWTPERVLRHCLATPRPRQLSKCERDPEVKAWLDDVIGRWTFDRIAAECLTRFGADRAPRRSAIHRYVSRLRGRPEYPKPVVPKKRPQ